MLNLSSRLSVSETLNCVFFFFYFRRRWYSCRGKCVWHFQLRSPRLFWGGVGTERDWRRQSSDQHRKETGEEQVHWGPHSQIRKQRHKLGFAFTSAWCIISSSCAFFYCFKTEACQLKITRKRSPCSRLIIQVIAVQCIRGNFYLSCGGRTALWQAA